MPSRFRFVLAFRVPFGVKTMHETLFQGTVVGVIVW